jgi:integrase
VRYAQAGLKRCSPHDFRRTYTSHLLEIYGDISIVQKLMGHANINTTARYDMRDQSAKRKAVQGIHIPFRPKGGKF